jgi:hypothetical protein
MIDVYQGVTNFENSVSGSAAINTVLSNATGAAGFYGIFGTHYDMDDDFDRTLFDAAQANDVPIISADQALAWLDGRNSSEFSSFGGGNGRYTFDIQAGMGAEGLDAMMPTHDADGTLTSLTRGTGSVSYQTETVKGVEYAVFDADPGSYTATYSDYSGDSGGGSSGGGTNSGLSRAASIKSITSSRQLTANLFGGGQPNERLINNSNNEKSTDNGANKGNKEENSMSLWSKLVMYVVFAVGATALILLLWSRIQQGRKNV